MDRIRLTGALTIAAALSMATAATSLGQSDEAYSVVASFDATAKELPEGVSIDDQGDTFVTLGRPSSSRLVLAGS